MKTPTALAFALLSLVWIAAAPAPTQITPELDLPDFESADPGICAPAPQFQVNPCIEHCEDIRRWCDANCSTSLCHRECRDSAVECMTQC
jgi:hypothetical protein